MRELKAKSVDETEIATGESVFVHDYYEGFAIVKKL